jgi:hypothetical protein
MHAIDFNEFLHAIETQKGLESAVDKEADLIDAFVSMVSAAHRPPPRRTALFSIQSLV